MASRYVVGTLDELSDDGDRVIAEVDGLEVAVFRIEGEYHAILNFCPHQSGPLCDGEMTGRTAVGEDWLSWTYDRSEGCVLCPWHGWVFDVRTGQNVDDDRYVVPTFEVEVDGDELVVVR